MFEGFDFAIPALFVTVGTIGLGGFFGLLAWADTARASVTEDGRRILPALYAFTASVCMDVLGLVVLSVIPFNLRNQYILGARLAPCVYSFFIIISFVLVIISLVLVRRDSGAVKDSVQTGSRALFVLDVLGFIWFVASSLS
jgi:hypothetical protein